MKYAVLKKESQQNRIVNAIKDFGKKRITPVDDNFKMTNDIVVFDKTEQARKYINSDKPKEEEKKNSLPKTALDDYINRNVPTVKKAIKRDNLDDNTLRSILEIEKKNKERKELISFIEAILWQ